MLAIYKREFKAFFQNVIGWIFIAANLFVLGLYFTVYNLINAYPYIAYALSGVMFLFVVAMPILSMRILSEEQKNKTDQLLYTAPVSIGKIVMGKFLAMASIFGITVLVACVYPLIMTRFGTVSLPQEYTSILGYLLYGLACLAIGMFISSITESQVLAAIGAFAILFITYMMSGISSLISNSFITSIMDWLDLRTPATDMMDGVLDLTSVVYYLSVMFIFLFLTNQSIQKRRWTITKTNRKTGLFSTAFVATAIVICVVVNAVVTLLPDDVTSIDVSNQKLYTLTDDTIEMLDSLDQDITIYVLVDEDSADSVLDKTLQRYEANSSHISVVYKDPNTYPNFYASYTDSAPTSNSLIVVGEDASTVIDYSDIYETEYSMDSTTYSYTSEVTGYDGEGQITSAISYVVSDNLPVVYVLEGQDESDLGDSFIDALTKKNITTESLNLLTEDAVPDDCACLIINNPQSDISEDAAQMILDYIYSGGSLMVSIGYTGDDMTNLNTVLAAYNMTLTGGLVVENDRNYYTSQTPYYVIATAESTDVSSSVYGDYIFLPNATGLTVSDDTDTVTTSVIAATSESAVLKMDPTTMTAYTAESGDAEGSTTLAAYSVLTLESASGDATESGDSSGDASETLTSQIVVMASGYFTDESANSMVSDDNLNLFSDIMDQLVESSEGVSIPVKDYSVEYLTVTSMQTIVLSMVFAVAVPIILIVVGVVIWAKRRKR